MPSVGPFVEEVDYAAIFALYAYNRVFRKSINRSVLTNNLRNGFVRERQDRARRQQLGEIRNTCNIHGWENCHGECVERGCSREVANTCTCT